jgi:hypothetical protein
MLCVTYAECHIFDSMMLRAIMQSFVILSVIMLSVIMLSVAC